MDDQLQIRLVIANPFMSVAEAESLAPHLRPVSKGKTARLMRPLRSYTQRISPSSRVPAKLRR